MERAVAIAEIAMHNLLPQLRIGQTEKEVAAMLARELMSAGADGLAFDPIVSAGPNAASPHAVPTNRALQKGELLIVDWGALVDGYVSDITRTFALGSVPAELRQIYDVVRTANQAGREAARPGRSGHEIDVATRTVIENAGYGEYFIHRTGHGLGMEAHERPQIVQGNDEPLPVGAVFTVEPGIYLPGRGGVRIEDDVVITPDGGHSLTSFPRDMITMAPDQCGNGLPTDAMPFPARRTFLLLLLLAALWLAACSREIRDPLAAQLTLPAPPLTWTPPAIAGDEEIEGQPQPQATPDAAYPPPGVSATPTPEAYPGPTTTPAGPGTTTRMAPGDERLYLPGLFLPMPTATPSPTPTQTPSPTPTPTLDFRALREEVRARGEELATVKVGFHGPAETRPASAIYAQAGRNRDTFLHQERG